MSIDPQVLAEVQQSLKRLARIAPGKAIEVRVPPYGAIQCGSGGEHRRGTPPNVVEMDAQTWLALVSGELTWEAGIDQGLVAASGIRADLSTFLPLPSETNPN